MKNWMTAIDELECKFPELRRFSPAPMNAIESVDWLPEVLREFYLVSNGLEYDWLKIFPVYDPAELKRTWDSISRANDPLVSIYADWGENLFNRFVVFAGMNGLTFAALEKNSDSIFFSDRDGLHSTDLSLLSFLQTASREIYCLE